MTINQNLRYFATIRNRKIPFPLSKFELGARAVQKQHKHDQIEHKLDKNVVQTTGKEILAIKVQQSMELAFYRFLKDITNSENRDLDIYTPKLKDQINQYQKQNQAQNVNLQLQDQQFSIQLKSIYLNQIYYIANKNLENFKKQRLNNDFKLIKLPNSKVPFQRYLVLDKNKSILANLLNIISGFGRYQQIQCKFETNLKIQNQNDDGSKNSTGKLSHHIVSFENQLKIQINPCGIPMNFLNRDFQNQFEYIQSDQLEEDLSHIVRAPIENQDSSYRFDLDKAGIPISNLITKRKIRVRKNQMKYEEELQQQFLKPKDYRILEDEDDAATQYFRLNGWKICDVDGWMQRK